MSRTETRELRIGIVGSRRRNTARDREIVRDIVFSASRTARTLGWQLVIISGACAGCADEYAAEAASDVGAHLIEHLIDKSGLPPYPAGRGEFTRRAYARNELIARDSKDFLFALVSDDRTGGTENTIEHHLRLKAEGVLDENAKTCLVAKDGSWTHAERPEAN